MNNKGFEHCSYAQKKSNNKIKKDKTLWLTLLLHLENALSCYLRFEEMKVAKGLKSVLKDAANYAKGLGITITFDKTKTVLTNEDKKNKQTTAST